MRTCSNDFSTSQADALSRLLLEVATADTLSQSTLDAFRGIGIDLSGSLEQRYFTTKTSIEAARGSLVATASSERRPKTPFIEHVFDRLREEGIIDRWSNTGTAARVDYRLFLDDSEDNSQHIEVEAKGGLDGNSNLITEWSEGAVEMWKWNMAEGSMKHDAPTQVQKNRYVSDLVKGSLSGSLPNNVMNGFFLLDYLCNSTIRRCPKQTPTIDILGHIESIYSGYESPFPDFSFYQDLRSVEIQLMVST